MTGGLHGLAQSVGRDQRGHVKVRADCTTHVTGVTCQSTDEPAVHTVAIQAGNPLAPAEIDITGEKFASMQRDVGGSHRRGHTVVRPVDENTFGCSGRPS